VTRNILTAQDARHRAFIEAAQAETARLSYGRPATADEWLALKQRLDAAFTDPNSHLLVIEERDKPVGYVWVERRSGGIAFLLDIFVAPRWRKQGIGTLLLREVIHLAKRIGLTELRLAVSSLNGPAQSLFAAQGLRVRDTEQRGNVRWFELAEQL
jgi:ribosomal protein S18 acetylase RimI-like enzyme